jgi:hypothetical protein
MSKRQDWCVEVSWNFFNLITPIITFTVSLCAMDENVLRDAVLVRLKNIKFEAYVHVNALMWQVAFAELRALTNRKAVRDTRFGLNPMELNDLYEYLRNMGVTMQSKNAMGVFEELKTQLALFGKGIVTSLQRTMYLQTKQTSFFLINQIEHLIYQKNIL